jgi:hypothetical protein
MKVVLSKAFDHNLREAPAAVQKAFWKQAGFLVNDIHHPSLRAKKYDAATGVWQARVTRGWRVYFIVAGDEYRLVDIIPHPK